MSHLPRYYRQTAGVKLYFFGNIRNDIKQNKKKNKIKKIKTTPFSVQDYKKPTGKHSGLITTEVLSEKDNQGLLVQDTADNSAVGNKILPSCG